MLLRRLTFTRTNSNASTGFNTETFKEDFTGNCKSVSYYLSNIERHLHEKVIGRKKPKSKHLRGLSSLKLLLVSLVRDLECNAMGLWFNELVCDQQRGHEVLLKLLDHLVTMPVRAGKKSISRDGSEQEVCAKCLVLISGNRLGLNCLAGYEHGYQILLRVLADGKLPAVKHICNILLLYCKLNDSTHSKLVSHMDCFKKKQGYESRFSVLIKLLTVRVEDFTYTSSLVYLLTAVVHSSPSLNIRTFYQQEVELELNVESILEGVPTSATCLHKAMREWRDKCIDIPVLTRKLEAAHATSGLLQEECRLLRDKLVQKEETTRALAEKQQQLLGSHDSTHNELSDMRCRLEDLSKELIREKVKVQRLEAALSSSQQNINITSLVNNNNNNTPTHARTSSMRRSKGEGGRKSNSESHEARRRTTSRSRKHHNSESMRRGDRRHSNRSSSGSDDCYGGNNQLVEAAMVTERSQRAVIAGSGGETVDSVPPLPQKVSTLTRRRGLQGAVPPAPPAPPAPPIPPGAVNALIKQHTAVAQPPPPPPPPFLPISAVGDQAIPSATSSPLETVTPHVKSSSQPCDNQSPTSRSDMTISVKTTFKSTKSPATSPTKATSTSLTKPPATIPSPITATPTPPPPPPSTQSTAPPKPQGVPIPGAPAAPAAPRAPLAPGAPLMRAGVTNTLSKKPQVKLPLLHWNPLRNTGGTYWNDVNMGSVLDELDLSGFEDQFKIKTQPTISGMAKIIKRKVECLSLLDTNRARNAMIIQRRVALPPPAVANCVEQTDLGDLPVWAVELLNGCVPSREESDKLIANSDKLAEFGEAELFCFHLSKVNRYDRKLAIMQFIGTFDEQFIRLSNQVKSVSEASTSVLNSARLKKVLELILALGNYMNSNRKGVAGGFKIQSLSRVAETHSSDYKFTLLHYIVKTIHASKPELVGFTMEFEQLDNALKVALKELVADVQEMKKNLDTVLDERDKQRDNFVIFSFYNRANRKVKRLGEQTRAMLENYQNVCKAFGENPKQTEPQEFFKYFSDFFVQFDKIEKELYQSDNVKKKTPLSRETSRSLVAEALSRRVSMF